MVDTILILTDEFKKKKEKTEEPAKPSEAEVKLLEQIELNRIKKKKEEAERLARNAQVKANFQLTSKKGKKK